jgi:alpha-L-rhamnosidase
MHAEKRIFKSCRLKPWRRPIAERNKGYAGTLSIFYFIYCFLNCGAIFAGDFSSLRPVDLRCEYLHNPFAIEASAPRLSWILETGEPSAREQGQTAYQILVAHNLSMVEADEGDVWDSGRVHSSRSIHVAYTGTPLNSGEDCFWKVRVWDDKGKVSAWSKPSHWRMGLLKSSDWHAQWIGLDQPENKQPRALAAAEWIWFPEGRPEVSAPIGARYFRRIIEVSPARSIKEATLLFTADNAGEVYINGQRAGAANNFRMASEVDVTRLLRNGTNVIAAWVENLDWEDDPNPAGFIASLEVKFSDGISQITATDTNWKTSNEEIAGWKELDFDETGWSCAQQVAPAGGKPWGRVSTPGERRLAARMARREFIVGSEVARATAHVCGLGLFEFYLNGQKIGTDVLSPALTDYSKRVNYITFDVTSQLRPGTNAAGVILGNGRFYAPRSRMPAETISYGFPKLLFQLQIDYKNGSTQEILSDQNWKLTANGPIRANNEYDGEEYDAQMEMDGWTEPGFDDSKWPQAKLVTPPGGKLSPQTIEPIRVTQTLKPRAITETSSGVYVFDFGQNISGWCRLKVSGPAGTRISIRHAQILNPDGSVDLRNCRSAKATDNYVLRGSRNETYEPRFSCHGFRYAEITGYPGKPDASSLLAQMVHDDLESAGEFECSNGTLNRIYRGIHWTLRSNYRSIPADCADRDERQGWLGDRGFESRGETYLFNTAAFFSKWLRDMEDAQKEGGSMPDIAPAYWPSYTDNVTWPSTTVILPGMLRDQYGDSTVIESHYDSMNRWLEYISHFVTNGIVSRDSYKDWGLPPEDPKLIIAKDWSRRTAKALLATAYLYYDLWLMAEYSQSLGRVKESSRFRAQAASVKTAFNKQFLRRNLGQYDNGSQTSCVLPLAFGLVPVNFRERIFDLLADKIAHDSQQHIGTGIIGGQWLLRVLTENGRPDLAYAISSQTTYPSLGYMLEKGATTLWELWNADTAELWNPDVAEAGMNSRNHAMHIGDLAIWLYEYLAGIKPDATEPGFKHIIFHCEPVRGVSFVNASHNSPYGLIKSEWKKKSEQGLFVWNVVVPPNTTGTISIPATSPDTVSENSKPAARQPGVKFLRMENARAIFRIRSGTYHFESQLQPYMAPF